MTIGPPLKTILDSPGLQLDGFIAPGHVSTVIGTRPYDFMARDYGKPVVVTAFEPIDILHATVMLVRQLREGRCEVENQYTRVVRREGNRACARRARRDDGVARHVRVARPRLDRAAARSSCGPSWPGGTPRLASSCRAARVEDPKACQCGEVLVGAIKPWECKVFGTACTPERPIGTCMVSSEGACAAYYNYGRLAKRRERVPA